MHVSLVLFNYEQMPLLTFLFVCFLLSARDMLQEILSTHYGSMTAISLSSHAHAII